jgi:uncharacterized protein YidB (DUF937 family)
VRVSLLGDSDRVWIGKDENSAVEAHDLVSAYARGELELDEWLPVY